MLLTFHQWVLEDASDSRVSASFCEKFATKRSFPRAGTFNDILYYIDKICETEGWQVELGQELFLLAWTAYMSYRWEERLKTIEIDLAEIKEKYSRMAEKLEQC